MADKILGDILLTFTTSERFSTNFGLPALVDIELIMEININFGNHLVKIMILIVYIK